MNLDDKTTENLEYMVEEIKKKMKMATAAAIKPSYFSLEHYEDVRDIYELIRNRTQFSISETEAIVNELGNLKRM